MFPTVLGDAVTIILDKEIDISEDVLLGNQSRAEKNKAFLSNLIWFPRIKVFQTDLICLNLLIIKWVVKL